MGPTQAPLGEGVDATFRTKPALKTIKNWSKIEKIRPGGTPWEAKNWNLQLRWPKMLPRVIFKRPWRPLGSALGGPRGSQVGAKSKLGGCFFEVEKARVFQVVFECIFDRFGSPLGKQKRAFRVGGVAKIKFSGSCVLTSSWDLFWRDLGGQVGAKLEPSWAL